MQEIACAILSSQRCKISPTKSTLHCRTLESMYFFIVLLPAYNNNHDRLIDHDDDVECKHGPGECLGNILELCAAQLHHDPMIYLGFTMCLSNDSSHIPQRELVHSCALEHGIDFDGLNDCASKDDSSFGMDLLRQSVARSAQANVSMSCTVSMVVLSIGHSC